jgi:vesicle transport through interaction with t-SNAREs protein 1
MLNEAKRCATAMQGLAEVEGNSLRVQESKNLLQRDIGPLSREVQRQLNECQSQELMSGSTSPGGGGGYQPPDLESAYTDMDSLIRSSENLLRESHSIMYETEHIGNTTLLQMGRQREQLENTNRHLEAVKQVAEQAKNILTGLGRRALKNKLALYCMIGLLGWANLYVLHLIYKKHHKGSGSGNP